LPFNCLTQNSPNKTPLGVQCIPPEKFYIEKFNHQKQKIDVAKTYPWKVVVGRDIEYEAKPLKNKDKIERKKWEWYLGDSKNFDFWQLQGEQNDPYYSIKTKGSKFLARIPQLFSLNSDFGETHGQILVKTDIDNTDIKSDDKKAIAQVFFEKDSRNNPGNRLEPNWFYYWSQIDLIKNLLDIPGLHLYDQFKCNFNRASTPLKLLLAYDSDPNLAVDSTKHHLSLILNANLLILIELLLRMITIKAIF
jgi:hypothetical protein